MAEAKRKPTTPRSNRRIPAPSYVRLEDAIDQGEAWVAARLPETPLETPWKTPPEIPAAITQFQELQSKKHHVQHVICYWQHKEMLWAQRHEEMLAFQHRVRCREAAKDKIFAKAHAGDLKLLLCSVKDPTAPPQPLHLGFVQRFRSLEEIDLALTRRLGDPHWRLRPFIGPIGTPVMAPLLVIDKAELDELFPAASEEDVWRLARDTKMGVTPIYKKLGGIIPRRRIAAIVKEVRAGRPARLRHYRAAF